MSSGRTIWWPKDTAWHRRERIVELGEEFGPLGPLVIDWLSCEAKVQDDGGWVKSGVRSVARGCYSDPVTVGHVLSRAVAIGQLEDFTEVSGRFQCRISGWKADNERGGATLRKRAQREREEDENGSTEPNSPAAPPVTLRDSSRPVTLSHLREEERREKDIPQPPRGRRKRDLDEYEQQLNDWAAIEFPDILDASKLVRLALGEGAKTRDEIAARVARWNSGAPEAVA